MPEHVHVLISEPKIGSPSRVMQVVKQRVSRRCRPKKRNETQLRFWEAELPRAFWQVRYDDFNVYSQRKHIEKLRYMHRNPVKRGFSKITGAMALEQLSSLLVWREGRGQSGLILLSQPLLEAASPAQLLRNGWGTRRKSSCPEFVDFYCSQPRRVIG